MHRSTSRAALGALALLAIVFDAGAAPPDWGQPATTTARPAGSAVMKAGDPRSVDPNARWVRVAGCARDITGGATGVIYVAGCDVVPGSRGSSAIYRWNGAAFVPLRVAGHGSAIATHAGNSHTIGGDAMLYTSINDGEWVRRPTPGNQPVTDVGAGVAGLWIVTSQPSGEGGNAIARARPCPATSVTSVTSGAKDVCGWEDMPGAARRIAVGDTAWVVNARGQIFEWSTDGGPHWEKRPGCFTDVAVNAGNVYAVSCKRGRGDGNAILRWSHNGWVDVNGAGKRVGVDAYGNAWAVTDSGEIWSLDNPMPAGGIR